MSAIKKTTSSDDLSISYSLPENSTTETLDSSFEIKQWWMYHEWDGSNPGWRKMIQEAFPMRDQLHPSYPEPAEARIDALFKHMRGAYPHVWGDLREKGKWAKVVVEKLDPEWVLEHVQVLYPSEDRLDTEISELSCLVLWKDPSKSKYQLLEGNHRVSSWLNLNNGGSRSPGDPLPEAVPCMLFIGKA